MPLCNSCLDKTDRGKSVRGALSSARNYVEKGSINNAVQEYNFIIHLLSGSCSCDSGDCINLIKNEKEMNT